MDFELILCDVNGDLCHEWRKGFQQHGVEVRHGDFFDIAADAYVSPANSHGIMDGGFDLLLRARFPGVDVRVQREIDKRGGLLPIGHAVIVETGDWDVPYVIAAPTMEIPSRIDHTNNVFLAMRGLLKSVQDFNADADSPIQSIAVPGLGTGVGRMSPSIAALQMLEAYEAFLKDEEK
jgi:O-acetyl-ADP-ribose deacetylase (regulator of RNase III)